jgi:tRNA (cmo5U34)-methyltransferase
MSRDTIFTKKLDPVPPFEFNESVATVFSDMIRRSVPGYAEIMRRQAQMIAHQGAGGCRIFDLGCSNGNLASELSALTPAEGTQYFAIDNALPMLSSFQLPVTGEDTSFVLHRVCAGIEDIRITRADVVIINFTLQFIPPLRRGRLIEKVFEDLVPGGILLLSEKVVHRDEDMAALQQEFHHRFKREHGYSELEISQKRDALEDVLIPDTMEIHFERLAAAGFANVDVWFKWFNFTGFICRK